MRSPLGEFLCPTGYDGPQGLRAIARESSAVVEAARLVRRAASDHLAHRRTPYASRHETRARGPVVLVPGFLAGDSSLLLLSRHLRRLGHRTYRSTMHVNVGCTQEAGYALERRVEAVAIKRDSRVTIVGHSLGGLLGRAVAARRPDLVDGIVTLGSPLLAPGAIHGVLAFDLAVVLALHRLGVGRAMGDDCTGGDCAKLSWREARAPLAPGVGFTSVYSRRDGIIDWRSCLDPASTAVEVATSHLGMAVDPVVFDAVAEAMSAHQQAREIVDADVTQARSPEALSSSAG
jgi:triacylglycerol lipase